MTEISSNDLSKNVTLHDIGLSSVSSTSETDSGSKEEKKEDDQIKTQLVKENNWLETCIEIRQMSARVLGNMDDVPIHSKDQQKFIRQIVVSLIQQIQGNSTIKTQRENDLEKEYAHLKKKYDRTKAQIHELKKQVSNLENKIQKHKIGDNQKGHAKNQVLDDQSNGEQINSSIEQIAKLVKQQTKNQQKLLDAVVSNRDVIKSQRYISKVAKGKDVSRKHHSKRQKVVIESDSSDISSDYIPKVPKLQRRKKSDPSPQYKQNQDLFRHINELVGKTNDFQDHIVDLTGNEELTLSKLSLLNDNLLKAERNFYGKSSDSSDSN